MSVKLIANNLPAQALASTNFAYVSWNVYKSLIKSLSSISNNDQLRVSVKNLILNIEADERIPDGEIALNRLHRQSAKIELREILSISIVTEFNYNNNANKLAGNIVLEVDMFVECNKPLILKEIDFIPRLIEQLNGQVLTTQQLIPFYHKDTDLLLLLTVKKIIPLSKLLQKCDKDNKFDFSEYGLVGNSTNFELTSSSSGKVRFSNDNKMSPLIFHHNFNFNDIGIGGLNEEFATIFRRAFASRVIPPMILNELGIHHVKGMLLYGPPGTGKTLIARQIAKVLKAREPKIVNGPEILNKYVGQSEENIRNLFYEAEEEYRQKGDFSALHIIILDEIDAICKSRGTSNSVGSGVSDSIVNQLLSKIDGVNSINNILLIGMTNRLDLIDEALLRPGRFEVHIEIGLPNKSGRHEILEIHTKQMRENHRLAADVCLLELADKTKNFSGAEIEGLVRAATSFAFQRHIDMEDVTKPVDTQNIQINNDDFIAALKEVKPAFGSNEEELLSLMPRGIVTLGTNSQHVMELLERLTSQVKTDKNTNTLSILLHGERGAGKSALASYVATFAEFPFTKLITPSQFIGLNELNKSMILSKIFDNAYKSDISCIILDDIERLIDYTPIGPRFSNSILQTLMVLIKQTTPKNRKLFIIATTSEFQFISTCGLSNIFSVVLEIPCVPPNDVPKVLTYYQNDNFPQYEIQKVSQSLHSSYPIKKLIFALDVTEHSCKEETITANSFLENLNDIIF
ncbi:putative vesicle-fusing ATPase [Cryptosporidium serpentis]